MKVPKYWKTVEFRKFQLKWKIVNHFTALRKLFSLPQRPYHQIKSCCVFETKNFLERYKEIYRHLLSKCFKKVVLGRQERMQCKCFFWHQTEPCLQEKFVNWENFLAVVWEHFIFNFKRVEIRKIIVVVLSEAVL